MFIPASLVLLVFVLLALVLVLESSPPTGLCGLRCLYREAGICMDRRRCRVRRVVRFRFRTEEIEQTHIYYTHLFSTCL